MLFLAVFLGFVAENIRERLTEKQKANELIASLIVDLQKDTASINWLENFRTKERRPRLDSFYKMVNMSPEKVNKRDYYSMLYDVQEFYTFSLSIGTINQLKNAGYLLYFSDDELLKYISEYDFMIQDFKNDETMEFHLHYDKLIELIKQNSDNADMYEFYVKGNIPEEMGIKPFNPEVLQSLNALMIEVMWYNHPQMTQLCEKVKNEAVDFMNYLKTKYDH